MPTREGTYAALLRDPRWQRRRLEIMSRDDFSCRDCGDNEAPLNVHHLYYRFGFAPWEYSDAALVTWCEPCHERFSLTGERRTAFVAPDEYRLGEDLIYEALCEYGVPSPPPSVLSTCRRLLLEPAILSMIGRLALNGSLSRCASDAGAFITAVCTEAERA